jgi:hypothetical protein
MRLNNAKLLPVVVMTLILSACGGGGGGGSGTDTGTAGSPGTVASIMITPAQETIKKGQTISRTVEIENADNAFYAAFDILYNPAVLQFVNAKEGGFMDNGGADATSMQAVLQSNTTVQSGVSLKRITIGLTRLGQIGGVSGSGTLVSVTFFAIGNGQSPIMISTPRGIKDMNNQEIAVNTWQDATVTVQ